MLREAERREISSDLRCKSDWLVVHKEEVDSIYLTVEELDAMRALDLSKKIGLEKVRDLFIIGCYTGLRFSDLKAIQKENIITSQGVKILKIKTQKTTKLVEVPINPIVEEILAKYGGVPPKVISNQRTNDHLKIIGKSSGINQEYPLTTFREGKQRHVEHKLKYELITTHTARRSFATNSYKAGVSTIDIMRITGHRTEEQFMKYLRLSNEEHALKMADHPFFSGKGLEVTNDQ